MTVVKHILTSQRTSQFLTDDAHPSPDTLARFIDGHCQGEERMAIIKHLGQCQTCYEIVQHTVRDLDHEVAKGKRLFGSGGLHLFSSFADSYRAIAASVVFCTVVGLSSYSAYRLLYTPEKGGELAIQTSASQTSYDIPPPREKEILAVTMEPSPAPAATASNSKAPLIASIALDPELGDLLNEHVAGKFPDSQVDILLDLLSRRGLRLEQPHLVMLADSSASLQSKSLFSTPEQIVQVRVKEGILYLEIMDKGAAQ